MTIHVTNQLELHLFIHWTCLTFFFHLSVSLYVAVSHSYGYGLLDASAMVTLAQNWTSIGPQHKCVINMLTEPR